MHIYIFSMLLSHGMVNFKSCIVKICSEQIMVNVSIACIYIKLSISNDVAPFKTKIADYIIYCMLYIYGICLSNFSRTDCLITTSYKLGKVL